ncbi:orotidine-5'-phosphate decarboxylase [Granulicoccus phenolivorans]|uniref:orotidine-5'-phosphate decarboxylase n=1 Tax=Granulicoccus phenolivorans TaxID=266854 RepID=UPI00041E3CEB|nr:orotidine-5'-phosphate decarboxylase [Granulicoccus phenolivorans]
MTAYAERLAEAIRTRGRLCVGIDPHPAILAAWGLSDDVAGLAACARGMVDALGDTVAVFKPQAALFEAYGSAGIAVLEQTVAAARAAGALVILDAKRGDIGSTMAGYARAYLGESAPLPVDAITLSPYLGFESLRPALDAAVAADAGVYVLCRTSNPEGGSVQQAEFGGRSVAQQMIDAAAAANTAAETDYVGLVIGGTHDRLGLDLAEFAGSILVPGIGAQGGSMAHLHTLFGAAVPQILPNSSRGIMQAGPDAGALREAVQGTLSELG